MTHATMRVPSIHAGEGGAYGIRTVPANNHLSRDDARTDARTWRSEVQFPVKSPAGGLRQGEERPTHDGGAGHVKTESHALLIEFDWPRREGVVIGLMEPIGFGVTALGLDDAVALVRTELFQEMEKPMPPVRKVIDNVDMRGRDNLRSACRY